MESRNKKHERGDDRMTSVLGPGAKKLLNYLQSTTEGTISVKDFKNIDEKWTRRTLIRIAEKHPELFAIDQGKISLMKEKPIKEYIKTRKLITESLERFLVGPFSENEELGYRKQPMQLYLTGKLVPFGSSSQVVNEEDFDIQTNQLIEEQETVDEYLSNRDLFRPSSMGFSFKMQNLGPITIEARWGMYEGKKHKRTQHHETWTLELQPDTSRKLENKYDDSDPARVKYSVIEKDGLFHVSLFLYNSYERQDTYPKQDEVMFQTKLKVSFSENDMAFFTSKADRFNVSDELLYREQKELAIGHGVGVKWEVKDGKVTIESTWLPFYELPAIEHRNLKTIHFQ